MGIGPTIVTIVWLSIAKFSAFGTPEQLPPGACLTSPNGSFTASYHPDQLEIQSDVVDRRYRIDGVLPIYALKWTGNSNALGIVHHLAGGSGVIIAHFNGTVWRHFGVSPPEEYDRIAVVQMEPHESKFVVSWKVARMSRASVAYYVVSAAVDPRTRGLSNVRVKVISTKKFDSLPLLGER
jgi:hypothetical protein